MFYVTFLALKYVTFFTGGFGPLFFTPWTFGTAQETVSSYSLLVSALLKKPASFLNAISASRRSLPNSGFSSINQDKTISDQLMLLVSKLVVKAMLTNPFHVCVACTTIPLRLEK